MLSRVYDMMCLVSCNFLNNIDLNYWLSLFVENILHFFIGQLEQHRGGAPAPQLISQWQQLNNFPFDGCVQKCILKFRTVAVDSENCDPMNLYRWLEGAHVKHFEIDHR